VGWGLQPLRQLLAAQVVEPRLAAQLVVQAAVVQAVYLVQAGRELLDKVVQVVRVRVAQAQVRQAVVAALVLSVELLLVALQAMAVRELHQVFLVVV
jgi:hypothetical protein